MVEFGDVGPRHIGCFEPAQRRHDEEPKVAAVSFRRLRLETDRDVFLVEALG